MLRNKRSKRVWVSIKACLVSRKAVQWVKASTVSSSWVTSPSIGLYLYLNLIWMLDGLRAEEERPRSREAFAKSQH